MCVYASSPSSHKDETQRQNLKPSCTADYADTMTSYHQMKFSDLAWESEHGITLAHKTTSLKGNLPRIGESLCRRYPETTEDTHKSVRRGKRCHYRRRLSSIPEEPCTQDEKRK